MSLANDVMALARALEFEVDRDHQMGQERHGYEEREGIDDLKGAGSDLSGGGAENGPVEKADLADEGRWTVTSDKSDQAFNN